jgi:hypothetical protein
MDHHVFISYSRRDADLVRHLVRDLRADGLLVWVDEEGLEPGTPEWGAAIGDAIERAGSVVAVLSPDAEKSPWVGRELNHAEKFGVRIIPILVRGDERNAVPFLLATTQWIDGRGRDGDRIDAQAFDQLLTAVCRHVHFESHSQRRKRLAQEEMDRLVADKERQLQAEQAEQEHQRREAEAFRQAELRVRHARRSRQQRRIGLMLAGGVLVLMIPIVLVIMLMALLDNSPGTADPTATGDSGAAQQVTNTPPPAKTPGQGLAVDLSGIAGGIATPVTNSGYSTGQGLVMVDAACDQNGSIVPVQGDGENVVFYTAWLATDDYGLEDYTLAASYGLTVDGKPVFGLQWTFSDFFPTGYAPYIRGVYVYFPYGPLSAGQHIVTLATYLDRVITDGVDYYGYSEEGSDATFENSCTFTLP